MDSVLIENKVLKLDKSNWKLIKVGDLAKDISKRVDNPGESEFDRFVSLRNFVSGDIKIKTWETTENLASSAKAFQTGDILFARRNAYLRRASLVDFDGCCSGDAFVLRENHDLIVPGFLAFFMNSNALWDYANSNAAGTMSKRVKWRDLAEYEILLPPKDQQVQLAKLLWAMDDVIEKEHSILIKNIKLKHSFRKEVFLGFDKAVLRKDSLSGTSSNWEILKISDACRICNTLRKPINKEDREKMKGEYPYYGPTSVLSYLSEYRIDGEYVLIGEDGDHFLKYADWNMTQYVTGKFNVNNHAHILTGTEKCLTKWIFYSLQHRNILPHIAKQGATRYKLNKDSLNDVLMLIPDVETQEELINKFDIIEQGITSIKSKIASSKLLQKSLINQVF